MTDGLLFPPPTTLEREFSFCVSCGLFLVARENVLGNTFHGGWTLCHEAGRRYDGKRKLLSLSSPYQSSLFRSPLHLGWRPRSTGQRTELVIHQPLLSYNGVFFSSKNSSPVKRRKYFKISLYKILCNNNTGVVRMASKIPRTNIFLLFFFKLFAWKRARKERIVKLFPNYSTIVSILN